MRRLLCCVLLASACGGGAGYDNPASPSPAPTYSNELRYCVDRTNEYRASIGRPPMSRSSALEAYAAAAAQNDGRVRVPHQYFDQTRGGGVAFAENLIPWWSLSRFGTVRNVVEAGLAAFWSEGPGGGHYRHMAGSYTQVGCGLFVNGDEVTLVQAFR